MLMPCRASTLAAPPAARGGLAHGAPRAAAFVLLTLLSLCIHSSAARADSCVEPFHFFPREGAIVSPDTQIWFFAEIGSGVPRIRREDGREVRAVPFDRRDVNHVWWGRRLLQWYAPVQELEPGAYWLSFQQSVNIRSEFARRSPIETSFTVVAGTHLPVPRPELRGFRWVPRALRSTLPSHLAVFDLWPPQNMLVADFGDADEDPLESLLLDDPQDGLHHFWLGNSQCSSNLAETNCLHTRVRFGALSGAGAFSGWTSWREVNFPGEQCPPAVVDKPVTAPRVSSWWALWLPASIAALALGAIAVQWIRRGRSN